MSKAASTRSTADGVEHHLTAFDEQDIETFLVDYTDDSVTTTNMGTSRGLDEIQGRGEQMVAEFSRDGVEGTFDTQAAEGAIGYTVGHGETPVTGCEFGSDTFVVRDGIIESQDVRTDGYPEGLNEDASRLKTPST